jgi:hypothetical protein
MKIISVLAINKIIYPFIDTTLKRHRQSKNTITFISLTMWHCRIQTWARQRQPTRPLLSTTLQSITNNVDRSVHCQICRIAVDSSQLWYNHTLINPKNNKTFNFVLYVFPTFSSSWVQTKYLPCPNTWTWDPPVTPEFCFTGSTNRLYLC